MDKPEMERLAKDPDMKRRRLAITDPTRMRILGLVSESEDGMTAKDLAERLRVDANRLYYHIRILEEAGVIEASELRWSGRTTERVYKEAYSGRYIWDID
ncbi:MAG: helix-turn-helix domain-containing protein, partial [Actinobacteria bacterium]|nr:helix-turn-helix domain-containing protein [Actinomycetota bacterium]